MKRYDLIVIGAGPAGLSAAIEGAKAGMRTVVFDENEMKSVKFRKKIWFIWGKVSLIKKI